LFASDTDGTSTHLCVAAVTVVAAAVAVQACTSTEWGGAAVWAQRPLHAAHSKAVIAAHLADHLARLLASPRTHPEEAAVARAVVRAAEIDAWAAAAGRAPKSARAYERRPHSERRKAEQVLAVELEILAKEEKVVEEQRAALREAAEAEKVARKSAKGSGKVFIGWGKTADDVSVAASSSRGGGGGGGGAQTGSSSTRS
jgi:hypothetical protein